MATLLASGAARLLMPRIAKVADLPPSTQYSREMVQFGILPHTSRSRLSHVDQGLTRQ